MNSSFDVPELIDFIASFLPNKALFQCIQVSKQWHRLLLPKLWCCVSVGGDDTLDARMLPALTLNSSWVRSLTITYTHEWTYDHLLILPFPILHTLSLTHSEYSQVQSQKALEDLILRQAHLLRSLTFHADPHHINITIFKFLGVSAAQLSRLRTLSLRNVILDLDTRDESAQSLLRRLDTFIVIRVKIHQVEADSKSLWPLVGQGDPSYRIQHLGIHSSSVDFDHFHSLMLECQDLRSLKLSWSYTFLVSNRLTKDLQGGHWPLLQCLHLDYTTNLFNTSFSDEILADVLLALGTRPLLELNTESSMFGPLSVKALLGQDTVPGGNRIADLSASCKERRVMGDLFQQSLGMRLEVLLLAGCYDVSAENVQQLLCSCSNLKRFSGPLLTDKEILDDPRPWACTGLRMLDLTFGLVSEEVQVPSTDSGLWPQHWLDFLNGPMDSSSAPNPVRLRYPSSPLVILERIALLPQLEELHMDNTTYIGLRDYRPLQPWVDLWFGTLRTLKRLRQMTWFRRMNIQDAVYMVHTWPALQIVLLTEQRQADIKTKAFLDSHGIRCSVKRDLTLHLRQSF